MDDKDVRRSEKQIAVPEQRSELRLEAVLTRIDGKLDLMNERVAAVAGSVREGVGASRGWAQTIIAVTVTLFALLFGLMVGLKQV